MLFRSMPSNHLILCRPLLLLPSIFPSIRVFSKESVLCIRWPNYWSFSFSISFSNEYSGLTSFRIDWFDLFAVQGTQESSPTPQFKNINSSVHIVKAISFSVVMYRCESWTIKKAKHQRTDTFELWCWRRLLSPLDCKEIKPDHSKGNQS